MTKKPLREKRAHTRFVTEIKAQCYHVLSDGTAEKAAVKVTELWGGKGEKPQSKGMVRDISFGGLYMESIRPFREGTILVIELKTPRKVEKVVVIGLVRWMRALKSDPPYRHGLGIQFIYMQKADWALLQEMFQEAKSDARSKGR